MKIRNGFVSNSSSSSFVCVMSPQTYEELRTPYYPENRLYLAKFARLESVYGYELTVIHTDWACPTRIKEDLYALQTRGLCILREIHSG